jgi:hypothetical protein
MYNQSLRLKAALKNPRIVPLGGQSVLGSPTCSCNGWLVNHVSETLLAAGSSTNCCGCDVLLRGNLDLQSAVSMVWRIVSAMLRLQLDLGEHSRNGLTSGLRHF